MEIYCLLMSDELLTDAPPHLSDVPPQQETASIESSGSTDELSNVMARANIEQAASVEEMGAESSVDDGVVGGIIIKQTRL
jgi:hypothetical protein